MNVADKNILDEFTTEFCSIVEKHCKYVIVSGYLAIATGRTRGTEDIDILIEKLPEEDFIRLHNDLLNKFEVIGLEDLTPKELYDEYVKANIPIRYVWYGKILPNMEFKLVKNVIDEECLKTRNKIDLAISDVYFSNIELQIAYKENYLKSDKDIEDARHLRYVFEGEIDKTKILQYKSMIEDI